MGALNVPGNEHACFPGRITDAHDERISGRINTNRCNYPDDSLCQSFSGKLFVSLCACGFCFFHRSKNTIRVEFSYPVFPNIQIVLVNINGVNVSSNTYRPEPILPTILFSNSRCNSKDRRIAHITLQFQCSGT